MMERSESPQSGKARIISSCSDGSIKFISPVSGMTIFTLFPAHKDVYFKELSYNANEDRLFYLCTNGDIVVYDTSTSPGRIIQILENSQSYKINCLLVLNNHEEICAKYDGLLVGTLDGQIIYLINGKPELFVQVYHFY